MWGPDIAVASSISQRLIYIIFCNPFSETDHHWGSESGLVKGWRSQGGGRSMRGMHLGSVRFKSFLLWPTWLGTPFLLFSDFHGTASSPNVDVHEMKIGPIIFQVAFGDITKEKADVIVNSTSKAFNLKAGTLLVGFESCNSQLSYSCCSQTGFYNFGLLILLILKLF